MFTTNHSSLQSYSTSQDTRSQISGTSDAVQELLRDSFLKAKGLRPDVDFHRKPINFRNPPLYEPKDTAGNTARANKIKEKMSKLPLQDEMDQKLKIKAMKAVQGPFKKPKRNTAHKLLFKNTRKQPIISSYFRTTYELYGKAPFNNYARYQSYNVLWEADWVTQEYIEEDEDEGLNKSVKKEEKEEEKVEEKEEEKVEEKEETKVEDEGLNTTGNEEEKEETKVEDEGLNTTDKEEKKDETNVEDEGLNTTGEEEEEDETEAEYEEQG